MIGKRVGLIVILIGMIGVTACSRIEEPWDTRDYFKQERTRTPEQEKMLRERLIAQSVGVEQLSK
jgi:hypothetical protein